MTHRSERGALADRRGRDAEAAAEQALRDDGWTILRRRVRTPEGEIDLIAERDALIAFVEVKTRPRLADAARAVTPRQQARLVRAAECLLAEHPAWGSGGVRFDVMIVDGKGTVRRIADAFRAGDA